MSAGSIGGAGGVQALGGGQVLGNSANPQLQDLIMQLGLEKKERNDNDLATLYGNVQTRLEQQQQLVSGLKMLNEYSQFFGSDGKVIDAPAGTKANDTTLQFSDADKAKWGDAYQELLTSLGVGGEISSDGQFTKNELAVAIEEIKGKAQELMSQNEQDMVQINKLNELNSKCIGLLLGEMGSADLNAKNALIR